MPRFVREGACMTMGPSETIFIEPSQEKARVKDEVEGWFGRDRASGYASINLYFAPCNKLFYQMAKPVKVMGHDVSLYKYDGGLYRISYGPGDAEQTLWYIGRIKHA